ncbi:hypothetical protein TNCV_3145521 [Trichonephila clavipes]|nr:hypothetical protein TNCV_3145521 [Trichonephila clavipes]
MADKDILEFVQSSKNIIDADSDSENEMNKTAPVLMSSERRKIMKSMHSYLDAHSNGEMNNKMDDVEQFVPILMLKKIIWKEKYQTQNSNSVSQQPMRTRAYCVHLSIRDHWALKCMSRCPNQVVSLKRNPQCFSPQAFIDL